VKSYFTLFILWAGYPITFLIASRK